MQESPIIHHAAGLVDSRLSLQMSHQCAMCIGEMYLDGLLTHILLGMVKNASTPGSGTVTLHTVGSGLLASPFCVFLQDSNT